MELDEIPRMTFNRLVSAELEAQLSPGGVVRPLIDMGLADPRVDIQLRTAGGTSWATIYLGLTSVLDVVEGRGRFRFRAARKHRESGRFEDSWSTPTSPAALPVDGVVEYLARILAAGAVDARYTRREGQVQTTISRTPNLEFGMVQREALPSFPSNPARAAFVDRLMEPTLAALQAAPEPPNWWPGVRDGGAMPRTGLKTDLIGIDSRGRLLVVEVKPSEEVKGLAWAPGQVRLYAEVFAAWASTDPAAVASLNAMADQRSRLGLPVTSHRLAEGSPVTIAPVIAAGPTPIRGLVRDRMQRVHDQLSTRPMVFGSRIEPVEFWQFDLDGNRSDVTTL